MALLTLDLEDLRLVLNLLSVDLPDVTLESVLILQFLLTETADELAWLVGGVNTLQVDLQVGFLVKKFPTLRACSQLPLLGLVMEGLEMFLHAERIFETLTALLAHTVCRVVLGVAVQDVNLQVGFLLENFITLTTI